MNTAKHNPDYKLVSVFIENKEFVYGETNDGKNQGLEVYHYAQPYSKGDHFKRSYRYTNPRGIPMIYNELYNHLKAFTKYCAEGHKLTLEGTEYAEMVKLLLAA